MLTDTICRFTGEPHEEIADVRLTNFVARQIRVDMSVSHLGLRRNVVFVYRWTLASSVAVSCQLGRPSRLRAPSTHAFYINMRLCRSPW
jgi:hypothetical protein